MPSKKYQIIARKYRPQTFAEVVGQDAIVTTLKNELRLKKLGQAYLFCGSRGTGKTTLARLFAKALNCSQLSASQEPCNECPSCLEVMSGRSLDILEIDGASNRGIDDIRELNETVGYAPSSGEYKIYIIDEVHMLTKEAFNALLKTLEEPPSHVKFFFATTEPHKVLSTITSRCQRFDLHRIPVSSMKNKLLSIAQEMEMNVEEEVLDLIAELSEGSMRDGESLLDQLGCFSPEGVSIEQAYEILGRIPRRALFTLDQSIQNQNLSYAFELTEQIFTSGKDLNSFLETLMEHFRLHLSVKLQNPLKHLSQKDREYYLQHSSLYTLEDCVYLLDFLMNGSIQLSKFPLKRIHIETVLLHLLRSQSRVTVESLMNRLNTWEEKLQNFSSENPEVPATPSVSFSSSETIPRATTPVKEIETVLSDPLQKENNCPPQKNEMPKQEEKSDPLHVKNVEKKDQRSRYDTLMRFAAVELEGSLIKE